MNTSVEDQFLGLADQIVAFLPNLLGGILLLLVGWLAGWLVKRLLIQLSVLIRIDRLFRRSRWASDFSKADVRYGVYNIIGNFGFMLIFLLFLDNALIVWKLTMLSDLLINGILFLPKIIVAVAIFGVGWLLSLWAENSLFRILYREEIPRASLISRLASTFIILFFSAISLVHLDVARQIVIIGFSVIFITLGALAIVITAIGGKDFIRKIEQSFRKEDSGETGN